MTDRSIERRALELLDQALDEPSEAREAWIAARSGDDAALRDRALALLRSGSAAGRLRTSGAMAGARDVPLPERIGAYRITGLIGRGGMGMVYRGERATGDFEHLAAIKVVRPGIFSDALIERFQRERQTLANLSHPHIARLFDGGETQDGEPYIVMEYVDGVSLGTWMAAGGTSRATRIGLFLDICSAVGFAHQNLIVHRDITPSNILVAHDGTAKLIDFGIARPPAADHEPSAAPPRSLTALSLTPGYAAPERLAGGRATTLSDLYSLGVLLERLLGDGVDADARAIIAQATAADPADRYPSVDALADDLRAWRDGGVVAARRGGRRYAIAKFVRRHAAGVAAGAMVLVLLVAALAGTLIANRRAEAARAEAEQRFQQTRSLAKVMMFEVYDSVSAIPGSTDARLLLASTAQRYLDSLAAARAAPADLRLEVGEGYFRLARVVGFTGGGSLGRREDGKRLLDRAHAILSEVHAAAPDHPPARIALAHLLAVRAGERLYGEDDSATARREARQARALLEGLPRLDARAAGALTGAYLYEGDSWGWDNDIPAAGRIYERGLRIVAAMPPDIRNSEDVSTSLSGLLRQSGDVYRYTGQPERAIARMGEAVALNRRLVAQSDGSPAAVRKLVSSLNSLADMHRSVGQFDPGLRAISEAQAIAREAMRASPADTGAPEGVALTGIVLAQIQSARGAHAAAVTAAEEVIVIRRKLAARGGGNKGARITLAVGLKEAAAVFRAAGDAGRGCAASREAVAILDGYRRGGGLSAYDRENTLKPALAELGRCRA